MTVRIEQKIVDQRVLKDENAANEEQAAASAEPQPLVMNEHIERPEFLLGTTYKIKPPIDDHAMYITINDIILNEGTDHETRRPYEVFINSKNMEHFQWVIALTRVLSAVFRKGGDVTFLVEELRSVHDPSGGYFKKGGVFMPLAGGRNRLHHRETHEGHWSDRNRRDERAYPTDDRRKESRLQNQRRAGPQRRRQLPAQRHRLRQVPHQGHGDDGWV